MDIKQLELIRDWLGNQCEDDTFRIIEENGLTIDAKETDNALCCLYNEILERITMEYLKELGMKRMQ